MRTITPADIRFLPPDAAPRTLPCTVCGHPGPHRPRLTVPALAPPHTPLTLLDCAGCGSGFYDPPGIRDFSDLDLNRAEFWRAYVEATGGIWETLWPPLAALPGTGATLLDVGCGFGFAVDAWRRVRGAEAVGVELAEYGEAGARLLDIPVHREMLEDCAPLAGRRFDVVYASEVIEHVPDPRAFVALLARFVADDGVLVLTTPCVDYVRREHTAPALLATLAPGFHGFLLSPRAFEATARAAGFSHVDVRTFGERQVLWASNRPLTVDPAPERLRPAYFDYLFRWYAQPDHASPVWQGYAFRLARDLANTGRVDEAGPVAQALADALVGRFGTVALDPEATVARAGNLVTQTDFGDIAPFFLPAYWFTLGTIAQVGAHDAVAAERWYRGAERLALAAGQDGAAVFSRGAVPGLAGARPHRVAGAAGRALRRGGRALFGARPRCARAIGGTWPRGCDRRTDRRGDSARLRRTGGARSLGRRAAGIRRVHGGPRRALSRLPLDRRGRTRRGTGGARGNRAGGSGVPGVLRGAPRRARVAAGGGPGGAAVGDRDARGRAGRSRGARGATRLVCPRSAAAVPAAGAAAAGAQGAVRVQLQAAAAGLSRAGAAAGGRWPGCRGTMAFAAASMTHSSAGKAIARRPRSGRD